MSVYTLWLLGKLKHMNEDFIVMVCIMTDPEIPENWVHS